MKPIRKSFLFMLGFLFVTLVAFACSSTETAVTSAPSENEVAVEAQKDPTIWLNGEKIGTPASTSSLVERLKRITKEREDNGAYSVPNNPPSSNLALLEPPHLENDVYLFVGPSVSVGDVGTVYQAVDENAGDVLLPRPSKPKHEERPTKPDPLLLAVMVGVNVPDFDMFRLPHSDTKHEYSYRAYFFRAGSNDQDLLVGRLLGGIEVLPNGKLAVNDPVLTINTDENGKRRIVDTNGRDVTNEPLMGFKPKQRLLNASDLKKEADKFNKPNAEGRQHIVVLTSGKATFQSLRPLFALADAADIEFEFSVT